MRKDIQITFNVIFKFIGNVNFFAFNIVHAKLIRLDEFTAVIQEIADKHVFFTNTGCNFFKEIPFALSGPLVKYQILTAAICQIILRENNDFRLDFFQIFKYLPYGPRFYDEDTVTDQPMRQIVAELIREKALRCLSDEIPHGIAVSIDKMKERSGGKVCDIDATIICEKDSHKGIIIGKQGAMLKKIGSAARYEIERMMEMKVNLQLWVKVKKDWRDSDFLIKNFGYDKKDFDL